MFMLFMFTYVFASKIASYFDPGLGWKTAITRWENENYSFGKFSTVYDAGKAKNCYSTPVLLIRMQIDKNVKQSWGWNVI